MVPSTPDQFASLSAAARLEAAVASNTSALANVLNSAALGSAGPSAAALASPPAITAAMSARVIAKSYAAAQAISAVLDSANGVRTHHAHRKSDRAFYSSTPCFAHNPTEMLCSLHPD